MCKTRPEREQHIQKASKGNLLERTRERIRNQMMPNFLNSPSHNSQDVLHYLWNFIKNIRGTDPFGVGKIVGYPQVIRTGIMGVVFKFTVEGGKKYIFKTSVFQFPVKSIIPDVQALEARNKEDVKTPKVKKIGKLETKGISLTYEIMEFVPSEFPAEEIDAGFYEELGEIMARMHRVKGKGFDVFDKEGDVFIGRSDVYIPFPAKIREAKEYVLEHNLMDEDTRKKLCGRAYTTLLQDFENGEKPTLIHRDMGTENILRTKPLTVIDPNPRLGHPYEDIAEYLVKITKYPHNTPEKKAFIKKHITAGYERLSAKPINPNLLDAAMIIRCTWKMYSKISKKVENAFEEASILSKMMLEMGAKHGIIKKNQA